LSGFTTHTHYKSSKFETLRFLGRLELGFVNDITIPIYKGGFKILFTRNSDSNVIYLWIPTKDGKEDPGLPIEGKITIKTFYLRVPVLEYNSEPKNMLIKELLDNRYIFQFKNLECIPMNVSGTSLNVDITNMIRSTKTNPFEHLSFFKRTNKKPASG